MNTTTSPAMPRISVSEAAAIYLKKGMMPLPLYFRGKNPSVRDWRNFRHTPETINKHFGGSDNIGLILGELVCVDLDSLIARRLAPQYLPATGLIAGRGNSPGAHWFYKTTGHLPGRKWKLANEDAAKFGFAHTVELLGDGQQVVVGPSVHHTGDVYDLLDGPPAQVEAATLLAACAKLDEAVRKELGIEPQPRPRNNGYHQPPYNTHHDRANIIGRAAKYLARIPPAVSGQGGHDATFHAAGVLVQGFSLTVDDAFPLLAEWNTRCQPPWTEAELRHKLDDAAKAPGPRGALLGPPPPGSAAERKAGAHVSEMQDAGKPERPADGRPRGAPPREPPPMRSVRELATTFPALREPVIKGLLRAGETLNLISASKIGKSWLASSLAISFAKTGKWLDQFHTAGGDVLIVDNELHQETSAYRIPAVGNALGVPFDQYADHITVMNLRGELIDLTQLASILEAIPSDEYKLLILDAFYRFLPPGTDENDNGAMAALYNLLDHIANKLGCAIVAIHHSSKGNQSGKAITDVGSGAGSMARAADSHVILRPHEEPGIVVMQAAARSWPPVDPLCLRWEFPIFVEAPTYDPSRLAPDRPKRSSTAANEPTEEQRAERERLTLTKNRAKVMDAYRAFPAGETPTKLREAAGLSGKVFGPINLDLLREGVIVPCPIKKGYASHDGYRLNPAPPRQPGQLGQLGLSDLVSDLSGGVGQTCLPKGREALSDPP